MRLATRGCTPMVGQTVGALTAKVCWLSLVCMLHRCTWCPGDTSLFLATFLKPGALVGGSQCFVACIRGRDLRAQACRGGCARRLCMTMWVCRTNVPASAHGQGALAYIYPLAWSQHHACSCACLCMHVGRGRRLPGAAWLGWPTDLGSSRQMSASGRTEELWARVVLGLERLLGQQCFQLLSPASCRVVRPGGVSTCCVASDVAQALSH